MIMMLDENNNVIGPMSNTDRYGKRLFKMTRVQRNNKQFNN